MTELSDKAREIKNAYLKEWRRKNPERSKKHMADYWERKAAKASTGPVCLECGERLEGKRPDAKFCSQACKQRYYREKEQKRSI
jgi:hypothetical protein